MICLPDFVIGIKHDYSLGSSWIGGFLASRYMFQSSPPIPSSFRKAVFKPHRCSIHIIEPAWRSLSWKGLYLVNWAV